jgi:hypothetical protein
MKGIFTADLHLSAYNNDKIDEKTGFTEKLSGIYLSLIYMIEYARNNKINIVIVGGDTFHNKSIIYSVAQSMFLDIIRNTRDINWIIISGNHDLSSMTGNGVSAIKCLDNEPNVNTIHKTTVIENILFVPWNPQTMINDLKNGKTDYAIAHLGLNEGILSSGISLTSDIGLKDLKHYKKVYLGHYHINQIAGNCEYVGSLVHLDHSDKNQEKVFKVIDFENNTDYSVPSVGYKKYFEFDISEDNKDEILTKIQSIKSEGHYIKLNKIDTFDSSDIEKEYEINDKTEKDITNRGITTSMSSSDKIDRYLEIKEIPVNKREKYKNVALEIINL